MTDMNTGAAAAPKRPTFLTVLCILSFIGGAWGVIGGAMNMFTGPATEAAMSEMSARMDEAKTQLGDEMGDQAGSEMVGGMLDGAMEMAQKAAANAKAIGISNIVLSIVSLLGVWMMWNLRKNGYWLYVLATLGGLAVPLIFLGVNFMSILSVGFGGLIGVLFIILYGVNLKHMR